MKKNTKKINGTTAAEVKVTTNKEEKVMKSTVKSSKGRFGRSKVLKGFTGLSDALTGTLQEEPKQQKKVVKKSKSEKLVNTYAKYIKEYADKVQVQLDDVTVANLADTVLAGIQNNYFVLSNNNNIFDIVHSVVDDAIANDSNINNNKNEEEVNMIYDVNKIAEEFKASAEGKETKEVDYNIVMPENLRNKKDKDEDKHIVMPEDLKNKNDKINKTEPWYIKACLYSSKGHCRLKSSGLYSEEELDKILDEETECFIRDLNNGVFSVDNIDKDTNTYLLLDYEDKIKEADINKGFKKIKEYVNNLPNKQMLFDKNYDYDVIKSIVNNMAGIDEPDALEVYTSLDKLLGNDIPDIKEIVELLKEQKEETKKTNNKEKGNKKNKNVGTNNKPNKKEKKTMETNNEEINKTIKEENIMNTNNKENIEKDNDMQQQTTTVNTNSNNNDSLKEDINMNDAKVKQNVKEETIEQKAIRAIKEYKDGNIKEAFELAIIVSKNRFRGCDRTDKNRIIFIMAQGYLNGFGKSDYSIIDAFELLLSIKDDSSASKALSEMYQSHKGFELVDNAPDDVINTLQCIYQQGDINSIPGASNAYDELNDLINHVPSKEVVRFNNLVEKANTDDKKSIMALAECYETGNGTDVNVAEAIHLYERVNDATALRKLINIFKAKQDTLSVIKLKEELAKYDADVATTLAWFNYNNKDYTKTMYFALMAKDSIYEMGEDLSDDDYRWDLYNSLNIIMTNSYLTSKGIQLNKVTLLLPLLNKEENKQKENKNMKNKEAQTDNRKDSTMSVRVIGKVFNKKGNGTVCDRKLTLKKFYPTNYNEKSSIDLLNAVVEELNKHELKASDIYVLKDTKDIAEKLQEVNTWFGFAMYALNALGKNKSYNLTNEENILPVAKLFKDKENASMRNYTKDFDLEFMYNDEGDTGVLSYIENIINKFYNRLNALMLNATKEHKNTIINKNNEIKFINNTIIPTIPDTFNQTTNQNTLPLNDNPDEVKQEHHITNDKVNEQTKINANQVSADNTSVNNKENKQHIVNKSIDTSNNIFSSLKAFDVETIITMNASNIKIDILKSIFNTHKPTIDVDNTTAFIRNSSSITLKDIVINVVNDTIKPFNITCTEDIYSKVLNDFMNTFELNNSNTAKGISRYNLLLRPMMVSLKAKGSKDDTITNIFALRDKNGKLINNKDFTSIYDSSKFDIKVCTYFFNLEAIKTYISVFNKSSNNSNNNPNTKNNSNNKNNDSKNISNAFNTVSKNILKLLTNKNRFSNQLVLLNKQEYNKVFRKKPNGYNLEDLFSVEAKKVLGRNAKQEDIKNLFSMFLDRFVYIKKNAERYDKKSLLLSICMVDVYDKDNKPLLNGERFRMVKNSKPCINKKLNAVLANNPGSKYNICSYCFNSDEIESYLNSQVA